MESPTYASSQPYSNKPCYNHNEGAVASGKDPVNLATGEHLYIPAPDLSVYNPYGPAVVYQRNFFSKLAKEGASSPGLPAGWIHGFDASMGLNNPAQPGTWKDLKLVYPNSAKEGPFSPVLDGGGNPTGQFAEPTGSEYIVTGDPSTTAGQWDSITITYKDRTKWVFLPVAADSYMLGAICNRVGRSINIVRDSQKRVSAVQDDQSSPNTVTLLSFSYPSGQNTLLSSITDAYGRTVSFGYTDFSGTMCLTSVSQISSASPAVSYDYWMLGSPARPHIKSVSVPSPTGSGTSAESYAYDAEVRVSSMTDPNGNVEEYLYESPDATRIKTKNAEGTVEDERLVIFDPANGNVMTGTADKKGNNTATLYGDSNNSRWPTKLTDQINRATEITYDQFGNVLTVKRPRGTTTTYTYDYTTFPLGRLLSVQEAGKTATSLTYYEPTGLVESITSPKPGATDGSTVTTTFTYDALGNVLTLEAPGNNAATSIVTTYNYTTDGAFSQSAKLGQPLTVTDNLGHTTHLRYDARGNVVSGTDALGHETDFIHNVADQLSSVIKPVIGP